MIVHQNNVLYPQITPFDLKVSYVEATNPPPDELHSSHVHPQCEIYINLTGDVSFMVENRIYPVFSGSIILTRPYEYHHCIYHSDALHKHFWILFSSSGNEKILKRFFDRRVGEKNLLTLSPEKQKELFDLCFRMTEKDLSDTEKYFSFFKLLNLLDGANIPDKKEIYSKDIDSALEFIDGHLCESITVMDIAAEAHVSVNTLERHFSESLHMTPSSYLKKKRLSNAAEILYRGGTVMEACQNSGFVDYSSFIATFKKAYGITPLKYKKQVHEHN